MTYVTTVTQKGQVTIPVDVRKYLNIAAGDQLAFIKRKNQITIEPAVSFLDLKGSIKTKKQYSDKLADKTVLKYVAKTYAQKNGRS